MPGFNIESNNPDSPNAILDFFTTYQWTIDKLGPTEVDSKGIKIHARELTLPSIDFEEETVRGASVIYKFPKAVTHSDIVIVFYDVVGVFEALLEWRKKIWENDATGIRPANEFMDTCSFTAHSSKEGTSYTVTAFNTWPKSLSHNPMSYENSDFKVINLTLPTSHIQIDFA